MTGVGAGVALPRPSEETEAPRCATVTTAIVRQEAPSLVKGEAACRKIVAGVSPPGEFVDAVRQPAHWMAKAFRRDEHARVFGIGNVLQPKPTPDIGSYIVEPVGLDAQNKSEFA